MTQINDFSTSKGTADKTDKKLLKKESIRNFDLLLQ